MKYIIKSGDTLTKIANAHEMSLAELLDANPQYKAHPDRISVGDVLVLPDGGEGEPIINDTEDDTDGSPSVASSADSHTLGELSAKYETGNRGPGTVSTGKGDAGGVSYGSYQMTSINGGTVGRFVSQAGFPWLSDFTGLTPGSAAFTAVWKKIAAAEPVNFQNAQHEFIKTTHFDPQVAKVKSDVGLDLTTRSDAVQDVVWSTAVQHGPNSKIIQRAIASLQGLDVNAADFDERLIKAIYAERGRKEDDGDLVYFSKNSKDVQQGVANRFVNEQKDALKMLSDET
ncbi:MAG: LysM peptidoglycan-binding domain-containing protein [Methylovulum sp.]|nr:LysM peptidoglycan-binding domain-containing protein [Methylovulum sp.]